MIERAKLITVSDKMRRGCTYAFITPAGRNFDPEFRPELTPKEMLAPGAFGGKYMTDCRQALLPGPTTAAGSKQAGRVCGATCGTKRATIPLFHFAHPD